MGRDGLAGGFRRNLEPAEANSVIAQATRRYDSVRVEKVEPDAAKGWYIGLWNSELNVAIGYAQAAIDEPHLHRRTTEIYLVARGHAQAGIEDETVHLDPGDVLVVEPGEEHTMLICSPDYLHFVVHLPGLPADEARADKVMVSRERLGLPG